MGKRNFKEFKFGWPVVLSSTFGIGLGMSPLPFYTIGVFAIPLTKNFGWGMDTVMGGITVFTLAAVVASPIVGYIADRIGARKTAISSLILFSLSFMAFGLNSGSTTLYLALWAIMAFAGAGTLPMTWTRAINNWFNQNRGMALGLSLLGTGVFGAIAKLFASNLIESFGWQVAYIGVASLPILIALPLAFFFFRDTDDPKVADRVAGLRKEFPESNEANKAGKTVKQSFKDWRFWLLSFAFILISFGIGGPIPNLERLFDSKGFDTGDAVFLASIIGYSVLAGRLLGGYLLDRFWAPAVAFILLSIPAISCILFQGQDLTYTSALIAVIILGLGAGVEYDLLAYLASRYFGMKNYSAIYGFLYGFFALGAGFGPYIYGLSFTNTGSYDAILGYSMVFFLIGATALLFLGKYPVFTNNMVETEDKTTS